MKHRIMVRTARIEARITQKKAAETLGLSRWTYKNREDNPHKFTMEQAAKIAKMLNRQIDELKFLP